jgi:hypothetical protein
MVSGRPARARISDAFVHSPQVCGAQGKQARQGVPGLLACLRQRDAPLPDVPPRLWFAAVLLANSRLSRCSCLAHSRSRGGPGRPGPELDDCDKHCCCSGRGTATQQHTARDCEQQAAPRAAPECFQQHRPQQLRVTHVTQGKKKRNRKKKGRRDNRNDVPLFFFFFFFLITPAALSPSQVSCSCWRRSARGGPRSLTCRRCGWCRRRRRLATRAGHPRHPSP